MSDIWYFTQGQRQFGPVSFTELQVKLQNVNASDTFVWREGFNDWRRVEEVPELKSKPGPPPFRAASGKSQTKLIIVVALAGLALAVLSEISRVVSAGEIRPLDTFDVFNPSVLGYWVGGLGWIPAIFIVIATAATARKAGLLISIFKGLGAIVGVSLVIIVVVITVTAAYPKKDFPLSDAGADRDAFVNNVLPSCIRGQQARPENKNLSTASINNFCTCYANSLADVTTRIEMEYFVQHQSPSSSMLEKINALYPKCAQAIR
jgi:GYF domain 2